jgi:UTP--glucose-1-phosphate uridylyltransferase
MASNLKSALPAHLKPSGLGDAAAAAKAEFARKHHGKTQSHMVSANSLLLTPRCLQNPAWQ